MSVRGVGHLLPGQVGFCSDCLFVRATVCSAEQATESDTMAASASGRVQSSQSPSDGRGLGYECLFHGGRGRRGLGAGEVRRSECLYLECPAGDLWAVPGTARAIGLVLCRAQGQPEAGIRSVEYCLEEQSAQHDAEQAD